jgi:hypothetical protein
MNKLGYFYLTNHSSLDSMDLYMQKKYVLDYQLLVTSFAQQTYQAWAYR